jgi:hypothetical protein
MVFVGTRLFPITFASPGRRLLCGFEKLDPNDGDQRSPLQL